MINCHTDVELWIFSEWEFEKVLGMLVEFVVPPKCIGIVWIIVSFICVKLNVCLHNPHFYLADVIWLVETIHLLFAWRWTTPKRTQSTVKFSTVS